LIRPQQQRLRDREAERLRGLEINHQLKLRRLLHWQVTGLRALQDAVDVIRAAPERVSGARGIRHESARLDISPKPEHRWQTLLRGEVHNDWAIRTRKGDANVMRASGRFRVIAEKAIGKSLGSLTSSGCRATFT